MKGFISSVLISILGFLGVPVAPVSDFGATIPVIVALFETSLASKITSTATSITLVTGTDKQGNSLSGTYGFIIDEGAANEEFVVCSASGTALTSCLRGVSVTDGDTGVAALQKEHRRGATIKITNYPQLAILSRILNGQESLPNIIYYNSAKDFSTASASVLVDKNYVDAGILAGCANSSTTVKGCVELATLSEMLAGTSLGGTGAPLVVPNTFFTASSSANKVVVSNTTGYIDSSWINLSSTGGLQATGDNQFSIKTRTTGGVNTNADGIGLSASASWFGGSGTDGALSITSGSTSLSFGGARTLVKNYSSISITGTGALVFSNPNDEGSIAILRSQGACTITSTAGRMVDMRLMGANGGAGGDGGAAGTVGVDSPFIIDDAIHYGGGGDASENGGTGGLIFEAGLGSYSSGSDNIIMNRRILVVPGAGGGGGGDGAAATVGGRGGDGGGALILECGGALNITGTIDVSGEIGANSDNGTGGRAGAGGGGGGGMIVVLYNTLTADSGTYTVSGGNGGNGGNSTSGTGTTGGGGAGAGGLLCAGGNGGSGTANGSNSTCGGTGGTAGTGTDGGPGGGGGAKGTVVRMKNNIF
ncbi:MAG: hypothetical protein [Podoviridae sp. ctviO18]|nr:MAG: hypothetical protein [Podoviridae sp. ctviO18]